MQVNTVYQQLFLLDSLPTFAESVGSVTFLTATGDKSLPVYFVLSLHHWSNVQTVHVELSTASPKASQTFTVNSACPKCMVIHFTDSFSLSLTGYTVKVLKKICPQNKYIAG